MMYFIVIIIAFVVAVFFVGLSYGLEKEKGKQNEKELETVKRACNARTNADIEQLRKRFKNK